MVLSAGCPPEDPSLSACHALRDHGLFGASLPTQCLPHLRLFCQSSVLSKGGLYHTGRMGWRSERAGFDLSVRAIRNISLPLGFTRVHHLLSMRTPLLFRGLSPTNMRHFRGGRRFHSSCHQAKSYHAQNNSASPIDNHAQDALDSHYQRSAGETNMSGTGWKANLELAILVALPILLVAVAVAANIASR